MLLVALYAALLGPFSSFMREKPFLEKVGYVPEPAALKAISADQQHFVAAFLIAKVISYYGGLLEHWWQNKIAIPPEYFGMYKMLDAAVQLDPYNMDAYYFAQSALVWGAGQPKVTVDMLESAIRYRTWDYLLPYFAAFDYAFFLKDYENAARCYKRVAELTGSDLAMNLAGRYLHESGRTELAVSYLTLMVKQARNDAIKKTLATRLRAFQEVRAIELAQNAYRERYNRPTRSIQELLQKGYLQKQPVDPYGGEFYIDANGKVSSTSKFMISDALRKKERGTWDARAGARWDK